MSVRRGFDGGMAMRFEAVAFSLYVFSLPLSISGMEILSTLLFLWLIVRALRGAAFRRAGVPPFVRPMLAFVAWSAITIYLGERADAASKWNDLGFFRFFVLYVVLYEFLAERARDDRWVRVLWLVTLVVGVYGVIQHFVPIDLVRPEGHKIHHYALEHIQVGPRVLGTFDHHLTFSNIYLLYAPFFLSLAMCSPARWWLFAHAALLYLVTVWTHSRMAWVAAPVTLAGVFAPRGKKWVVGGIVAVVLAFAVTLALNDGMRGRIIRTFDPADHGYNLSWRQCVWRSHWKMFLDHPWLGVGFHNNGEAMRPYARVLCPGDTQFDGNAHNTPLEILATTGIPGLVLYLWLWWEILVQGWRRHRAARGGRDRAALLGIFVALIGFNIQGLTQLNFYEPAVMHNLMFFLAALVTLGGRAGDPAATGALGEWRR